MTSTKEAGYFPRLVARRARETDAWAIKALIDRYVASGTLLPRTLDFICDYAHEFIVEVAGQEVVGCVHLDEYAPSLAELRSLAVHPDWQGKGVGRDLVLATEKLARSRGYATLFAVSNDEEFFRRFGFEKRHIPELDIERSEVSRFKGVHAKDLQTSPSGLDSSSHRGVEQPGSSSGS